MVDQINNRIDDSPIMLVVAGPSGSGKSSVFPVKESNFDYFCGDDIAAVFNNKSGRDVLPFFFINHNLHELNPDFLKDADYNDISPEIGRVVNNIAVKWLDKHIREGKSFAIEDTLKTDTMIGWAEKAKYYGFHTHLIYVGVDNVDIAADRVEARAKAGKLFIPKDNLEFIREMSLYNLPFAIQEFDTVEIYDNSQNLSHLSNFNTNSIDPSPARLIVRFENQKITYLSENPADWVVVNLYGTEFDITDPKNLIKENNEISKKVEELKSYPVELNLKIPMTAENLYNAYANIIMRENNGEWIIDKTDRDIVQAMLNDGFRSTRIIEVLQHSPALSGLDQRDQVFKAYEIVKSVQPAGNTLKVSGPQIS